MSIVKKVRELEAKIRQAIMEFESENEGMELTDIGISRLRVMSAERSKIHSVHATIVVAGSDEP